MKKAKKAPVQKRKSPVSKKKPFRLENADPEMDVLQERFATSNVDFNALMDLVR